MSRLHLWPGARSLAKPPLPSQPGTADINPATWASARDLIEMRRHAGKIDLGQAAGARSLLAGAHLSRMRGRGMDYQESRVYAAGDDVRNIDWRVTARTGSPHTKLYHAEQDRPVLLAVDVNPGMFFASCGMLKSVVAARVGALIAWAAVAQGDRVGGLVFNGTHQELPPRGGRQGVLRLIRLLIDHTEPGRGVRALPRPGGFNDALRRLCRINRAGGLAVLVSDFYGIDDSSAQHLLDLRRQGDVLAVQIVDRLEGDPPAAALYSVTAAGRPDALDLRGPVARRAYQAYFRDHHRAVEARMRSCAIPLLRLSTDADVARRVREHFAGRTAGPLEFREAA